MKKHFFKTIALAIIFVICFITLGTAWGTQDANSILNVARVEWKIVIDGMVDHSINLTLSQIVAMPKTKVNADLYCYGSLVSGGNWYGVRLGVILENSGLHEAVKYIQFVASDGYATFLDISTAMREDVILAYELNGQPLPEMLRLVLPDENGDKWIALITQITAVAVPISFPGQPSLTPTMFREAAKSQSAPSSHLSDESTQAINESNMLPFVLASRVSDDLTIQSLEFLRAYVRNAHTIETELITPEPSEPTSIKTESTTPEPTTPEPTEPELTQVSLIATELVIIVAVTVACVIGGIALWALRKRK